MELNVWDITVCGVGKKGIVRMREHEMYIGRVRVERWGWGGNEGGRGSKEEEEMGYVNKALRIQNQTQWHEEDGETRNQA